MSDLTCPECGASVPDTGMSSSTGVGDDAGNISLQPERQHTVCVECDARLVRNPKSDVPHLREWRRRDD